LRGQRIAGAEVLDVSWLMVIDRLVLRRSASTNNRCESELRLLDLGNGQLAVVTTVVERKHVPTSGAEMRIADDWLTWSPYISIAIGAKKRAIIPDDLERIWENLSKSCQA